MTSILCVCRTVAFYCTRLIHYNVILPRHVQATLELLQARVRTHGLQQNCPQTTQRELRRAQRTRATGWQCAQLLPIIKCEVGVKSGSGQRARSKLSIALGVVAGSYTGRLVYICSALRRSRPRATLPRRARPWQGFVSPHGAVGGAARIRPLRGRVAGRRAGWQLQLANGPTSSALAAHAAPAARHARQAT